MSARKGLLIAAYALMLAAAVCALTLFGIQTVRLHALRQQDEAAAAQFEAELGALSDENAALESALAQAQALAA